MQLFLFLESGQGSCDSALDGDDYAKEADSSHLLFVATKRGTRWES